jgi:probable rRNA maturation factor
MYRIIVQRATKKFYSPDTKTLAYWAKKTLKHRVSNAELTIRIVTEKEMTMLNGTYRKKDKPTNVLSFPFDMPSEIENELQILGDIVICAKVITDEAKQQHKELQAHWAHMIIHGCLHLLGHDHIKDDEAEKMESIEISILKELGFQNPYIEVKQEK